MASEQPCVRDVMMPPTQTIGTGQTLVAARQRMMGDMNVKSLIVVDGDRPVGMLRFNDIRADQAVGGTVADVMMTDVPTAAPDQDLEGLVGVMTQYDIDRLPVVDAGGTLTGEVTRAAFTHAETTSAAASTTGEALSDSQSNRHTPVYNVRADMAVVGSQGGSIGKVKEVLSDSLTGALTHVVVHTGLLFGKDKSVPADLIDRVEGDQVALKVDKTEIDILPDMQSAE